MCPGEMKSGLTPLTLLSSLTLKEQFWKIQLYNTIQSVDVVHAEEW